MNLPGNASDEKELAGRRVLVTGATRGMGRAIAGRLAGAGASVVATARSNPADAPGRLFVPADVSTPEGAATIAAYTLDQLGGVDIVVHAAGASLSRSGGALALDDATWQRNLDINLLSAVRLDRALLPPMLAQRSAVIIHVSSAQWRRPDGTAPGYAAAKAALTNYSKGPGPRDGPARHPGTHRDPGIHRDQRGAGPDRADGRRERHRRRRGPAAAHNGDRRHTARTAGTSGGSR